MIKGVSRTNIAKSGLSLKGMSWDLPVTRTSHPEGYYAQDLHTPEDLMKKHISLKVDQLKEKKTLTNPVGSPARLVRARPVAACSSWNCVRGALLANAHWKGPSSTRVLKIVLKLDSESMSSHDNDLRHFLH